MDLRFDDFIAYHCPPAYATNYQFLPQRKPCTSVPCLSPYHDLSSSGALTRLHPAGILPIL